MVQIRRYERVSWLCQVILKVLPNGPVVQANTFDISIGGVGIATEVMLERGKSVVVRFYMHDNVHDELIEDEMMGKVAYTHADENGNRIGIEFMEIISESAHPALAAKIDHLSSVAC